MTASILYGTFVAQAIRNQLKARIVGIETKLDRQPSLAVIIVGEDYASKLYIGIKPRTCAEVGIRSINHELPEKVTQQELLNLIQHLNEDKTIDGILVQLPLPAHIDKNVILASISYEKDVDGLTPFSCGAFLNDIEWFVPSTALAVSRLIDLTNMSLTGKIGVVIGTSVEVGRPVALYMMKKNMTVLSCNRNTVNLSDYTRTADVIVSSTGVPKLVTADMVKKDAVVIDVGISRVGNKIVGDVDFEAVKEKAGWITPVPGGVGPVTVACLLENTVLAAEKKLNKS